MRQDFLHCHRWSAGGDKYGDNAHRRWLALVSVRRAKTLENRRSPALTGASFRTFNPQVVGSIPTPVTLFALVTPFPSPCFPRAHDT